MVGGKGSTDTPGKRPWGLRWRSSLGFVTIVVMLGLFTDLLAYSLIIPVIPYQLETLGYDGIGAKVSWLLVAFSGTLVLVTLPVTHYSEVHRNRKIPLLVGLVALAGSQVVFMEASSYWLMIIARFLQGASSTVVWTVGLALLCDTAPERDLGRQFGIASVGITTGSLVGPPIAGALYQRWGFRAPFIFGIIITGIDFLARLFLIERHEAMRWGIDPMTTTTGDKKPEGVPGVTDFERAQRWPEAAIKEKARKGDQTKKQLQEPERSRAVLLPHIVLIKLMKSSRAVVCIILTLIWGFAWTGQETTVVLHLNRVWGLDSHQAGIAFIAAVVPTIFSGVLSGWLGDRYGSASIGCTALLLSLPWCGLVAIEGPLAVFLTFIALEVFFASCLVPIIMLELSSVAKIMDSVGYAHVYGAFNLAYGIGTTVGPIVTGQMYDHIERGWFAISFTAMGSMLIGFILALLMLGERPLGLRLFPSKGAAVVTSA